MKKSIFNTSISLAALIAISGPIHAQNNPQPAPLSPAAAVGGMAGGKDGTFSGYVPSAVPGMYVGGGTAASDPDRAARGHDDPSLPSLSNGRNVSADKVEGFNEAIEEVFPMTPEMTRRYREIYDQNQRALLDRPEPKARVDAGFISLEPGETPTEFKVAPGIASVIGFYDATGQAWPISQYVLGNGANFQVIQLGEDTNNIAITPLARFGWTNLVVVLEGQPKPVVMRVSVSEDTAHFRHDVQVMARGPNASENMAASDRSVREAGSSFLLAALSGVDLPASTKAVGIAGVDARGWMIGESLYIRSKHALLSPSWLGSMSGPDGIRVYELSPSSVALFSVDGTIVRADVTLP